MLYLILF